MRRLSDDGAIGRAIIALQMSLWRVARVLVAGAWLAAGAVVLWAALGIVAIGGLGPEFLAVAGLGASFITLGALIARKSDPTLAGVSALGSGAGLALIWWIVSTVDPARVIWRDVVAFGILGAVVFAVSILLLLAARRAPASN